MILLKEDINFISGKNVFYSNRLKKKVRKFAPIISLPLLLIVVYFWVSSTTTRLKEESKNLKNQIEILTEQMSNQNFQEIELNEENKYPSRSVVIEEIYEDRNIVTPTMDKILKYIPEDVYITGVRVSRDNQMNVDFVSPSILHTLRLVFSFNNSGVYEEIPLPSLELGEEERTFSLNLRLKEET